MAKVQTLTKRELTPERMIKATTNTRPGERWTIAVAPPPTMGRLRVVAIRARYFVDHPENPPGGPEERGVYVASRSITGVSVGGTPMPIEFDNRVGRYLSHMAVREICEPTAESPLEVYGQTPDLSPAPAYVQIEVHGLQYPDEPSPTTEPEPGPTTEPEIETIADEDVVDEDRVTNEVDTVSRDLVADDDLTGEFPELRDDGGLDS